MPFSRSSVAQCKFPAGRPRCFGTPTWRPAMTSSRTRWVHQQRAPFPSLLVSAGRERSLRVFFYIIWPALSKPTRWLWVLTRAPYQPWIVNDAPPSLPSPSPHPQLIQSTAEAFYYVQYSTVFWASLTLKEWESRIHIVLSRLAERISRDAA